MSDETDTFPSAASDDNRTQPLNEESIQPPQTAEPILVSEDESDRPPSSVEAERQSEFSHPVRYQNKQHQRKKLNDKTRQKKRHGARNQHRHKFFVKWLISKFDLSRSSTSIANENGETVVSIETEEDSKSVSQTSSSSTTTTSGLDQEWHILDVAGGKGEVSARLTMCHQQRVVMVDPRPADIVDCYERIVLPKIPNKWQRRLEEQRKDNPAFVRNIVESRFKQLVTTFDDHKVMFDVNDGMDFSSLPTAMGSRSELIELQDAVKKATLIVGLHADGATEAIVDAALKYKKPFVVVPCCVFPNFFPMRRLLIDQDDGSPPQAIPVRTHEQFCKFLYQKDPRFIMEELPFEGRNIAIWWDGK